MKPLLDYTSFHLVGIQGVGMTALALILHGLNKDVSGSDTGEEYLTKKWLLEKNIPVYSQFSPNNLKHSGVVIYGAANSGADNIEVKEAQKQNRPVVSLAEFIGILCRERSRPFPTKATQIKKTVAVCGCHGKTTTTALLAFLGEKLNLDMSYYVGSAGFMNYPPGRWGKGKYFVLEADEYAADPKYDRSAKFLYLNPKVIICTNLDFDHPDLYKSFAEVEETFFAFFNKLSPDGYLIINGDDQRLVQAARKSGKKFYSYGKNTGVNFKIQNLKFKIQNCKSKFKIKYQNQGIGEFETALLGEHNVYNLTAALVFYYLEGFAVSELNSKTKEFTGVKRRQELIYKKNNYLVYDDYAHHPTEIKATLLALKTNYPQHQLVVLFQPHTYSRTAKFKNEFIEVLGVTDKAFVLPIFASAREKSTDFPISSKQLAELSQKKGNTNLNFLLPENINSVVESLVKRFDKIVFVTMGAGDVYKYGKEISNCVKVES